MTRSTLFAGALAAVVGWSPAAFADDPRAFLEKALQGDNSEIMLGRLAADQAQNPAVRDFGNTLVNDHRQARDEVRQLGEQFGIQDSREVAPEAREERDRLMGLRGRDFDREFVRYMVDDHRKDIGDFREEARERHGPVSALAERQLPTLRQHLRIAIALDRSDSRSGEAMDENSRGDDQYRGQNRYGDAYGDRNNNEYSNDQYRRQRQYDGQP